MRALFTVPTKLTIDKCGRFWCMLYFMPFIPSLEDFQALWEEYYINYINKQTICNPIFFQYSIISLYFISSWASMKGRIILHRNHWWEVMTVFTISIYMTWIWHNFLWIILKDKTRLQRCLQTSEVMWSLKELLIELVNGMHLLPPPHNSLIEGTDP